MKRANSTFRAGGDASPALVGLALVFTCFAAGPDWRDPHDARLIVPGFNKFRSGLVDWLRMVPPAAVLAAPVVATLVLRRRALRLGAEDPQRAWIAFAHAQQRMARGSWLAWLVVIPVCNANVVILRAINVLPLPAQFAADAAFFLLPAIPRVVCKGLAYPVCARVRGAAWSRGDLVWQGIWSQLVFVAPILLAAAGLGALNARAELEPFGAFRAFDWRTEHQAWGLFLVAGVAGILCNSRLANSYGVILRAVSSGELRDRVFELAKKASVTLRDVRVVRVAKEPIANAIAFRREEVRLTDYLLTHLSRREVDAIVAHELAHLRRDHTRGARVSWLSGLAVFAAALAIVLGTAWPGENSGVDLARWLPLVVVLVGVAFWLDVKRQKRRFEDEADADEVALTGDPEACIRALVKLDRLNWTPIRSSLWGDWFSTHPSTQRRIEAMARQGGMTAEELRELTEIPDTDLNRYPLPAEAMDDTWIFSSEFRRSLANSQRLSGLAVRLTVPTLTAAFLVPRTASPSAAWAIWVGCVAATAFCSWLLINLEGVSAYRRLERRWRKRLEKEGIVGAITNGKFVGLSPGAAPRFYDAAVDWDMGLVLLTADRLVYLGEKVRFALGRDQVNSITSGTAVPNWPPLPRLYVSWHDKDQAIGGTFGIWTGPAVSAWQCRAAMSRLGERVRNWRQGASPPSDPSPSVNVLPTPQVGAVTSRPLSDASILYPRVLMETIVGVALVLAFGLSLTDPLPRSAFFPPVVAAFVLVLRLLPWWSYRDREVRA